MIVKQCACSGQLQAKETLLKEQAKKQTLLQDKLQSKDRENASLASLQSLIQQGKQELARKDQLIKHWKDKFDKLEKVH